MVRGTLRTTKIDKNIARHCPAIFFICFAVLFFGYFFFSCSLRKTIVIFAFITGEEEENNADYRAQYPPTATVNVMITTDLHTNIRYKNQYA